MDFHIYKKKDERSFKVVLKNVHPSINLEELKQDKNNKGHRVQQTYGTCGEERNFYSCPL